MGKSTRLTDAEKARIVELARRGWTCRQVAVEVSRSPTTVSRTARQAGVVWGEVNQARANATVAYGAERRAVLASQLQIEAEKLLAEIRKPMVAYNFGGKDNTYNERTMSEPDTRAKRDLVHAATMASKAALEIDKHDNRSTDVDQAAGLIVALVDGLREGETE